MRPLQSICITLPRYTTWPSRRCQMHCVLSGLCALSLAFLTQPSTIKREQQSCETLTR